jgi:hypothetical protein
MLWAEPCRFERYAHLQQRAIRARLVGSFDDFGFDTWQDFSERVAERSSTSSHRHQMK